MRYVTFSVSFYVSTNYICDKKFRLLKLVFEFIFLNIACGMHANIESNYKEKGYMKTCIVHKNTKINLK